MCDYCSALDYAYDYDIDRLFAVTFPNPSPFPRGLLALTETGTAFPNSPGTEKRSWRYTGSDDHFPAIEVIEYVGGLGLYGIAGYDGYLIDPKYRSCDLPGPVDGSGFPDHRPCVRY